MEAVASGGAAPGYLGSRPPPLTTRDDAFPPSPSSSESEEGDAGGLQRPLDRELKKAAEKKFRQRYLLLQQAYEQRLQALAAQVRHVIAELQSDTTIAYLQQDPLTHEYANARVGEVLLECFAGEKEKYVKVVSDQIAWQTNDLREAHTRIRVLEKKEKAAQIKWKHAQGDIRELQQQLTLRMREVEEQQREARRLGEAVHKIEGERDDARRELDRQRVEVASLESLRHDYEIFQVRVQSEREQGRAALELTREQYEKLRDDHQKLEVIKDGIVRDNQHLRQLLSMEEAKNQELSNSLRQVQAQEYSTRLVRMEHELAEQTRVNETLRTENERLQKKYEEFGVQVELYMEEQSRERSIIQEKHEEREKKLLSELAMLRSQSVDAIKVKQSEVLRLADQIKYRQETLMKAEQKISVLEEKLRSMESALREERLHGTKIATDLEKDVVKWRDSTERQQELVKNLEVALEQTKQEYEQKLKSMQETMEQQHQQVLKERELEARTHWQNDYVAKQEARIEALKSKYEAALEAQQLELVQSRQAALDATKSAADKVGELKSLQQLQRAEEDDAKRRREELREAERLRIEAERAREATNRKLRNELEEKEKRVRELEQKLADKERLEERRHLIEDKLANDTKSVKPSVVVLNVHDSDELEQHEEQLGAQAISIVKRHRKAQARRQLSRVPDNNQESVIHEDCIPIAQHRAELQAREAQIALEGEKRLQKEMHEFQERKERELRNAMVNVRKGIQKLESSLDNERNEKRRIEEELMTERNAFVELKSELDDSRDAKRNLSQRLEEANEHLGRLRDVVKDAQHKATLSADRLGAAVFEKDEAQKLADSLKGEIKELKSTNAELSVIQVKLEAELCELKREREELLIRLKKLDEELTLQDQQIRQERQARDEFNSKEVQRISDEFVVRVRALETQIVDQQSEVKRLERQVEGDAQSIKQVSAEKLLLEETLQVVKADLANQRKEFKDLVRMHKNLNETMNAKVRDEQEKCTRLEAELITAQLSHKATQLTCQRSLEVCLARVRSLKSECDDLRKATRAEVKVAWKHTKKETHMFTKQIQAWITESLEQEKQSWESMIDSERTEWRSAVSSKEHEIAALVAEQEGEDRLKQDILASELENKSRDLRELQQQSAAHLQRIDELLLMVKKLEDENRVRGIEHSQLIDQLSSSRVVTDREVEAKQNLEISVSKIVDATHTLIDFVRQIIKEFALDPRRVLRVLDSDSRHPETWKLDELSLDLRRILELLQERMTAKEVAAADLAARPIQTELSAAREAFMPLLENSFADDAVARHLPWYALIARSIKQQVSKLQDQLRSAHQAMDAKEKEMQELQTSLSNFQQSHATLLFEKDTLSHEMTLQLQTLQKRREADLQQVNEEHERRLEQMHRRVASDQLKAREEFDSALEELKLALDAERRTSAKLKQDVMIARAEQEKLHSEHRDRENKIEKELEYVRDELAKWKRKAKLSTSKSPGTPSRRPSVMFSSPFHSTDDDASEASLQLPVPRRPSSAMADLSNLMEQSLQDLRKDNEGISVPLQQASPARLLESPMRRGSANTRPSPLRIPMYPSPARKRTSLVPPPRLISTVTGNSLTTSGPLSTMTE